MEDVYCEKHNFWFDKDDNIGCPICYGINLVKKDLRPLILGSIMNGIGVEPGDPRFIVRMFAARILTILESVE